MVRRLAREFRAGLACTGVALFALSCENPNGEVATRTSALVGDPIESVQQVAGVAPVTINSVLSPPDGGSIDQTSFTIGLFDEDDATLCPGRVQSYCLGANFPAMQDIHDCPCGILKDLDPLHRGDLVGGATYPFTASFDDVSVVELAVNVGSARAMRWDWEYKTYFQRPFNEFWVEVVDQNGFTTTVIDKTGAPDPWGFRPLNVFAMPAYVTGPQHVDLDLTPWSGQKIRVRFLLHSAYDPHFFTYEVLGFPLNTGVYDMGTSKAYVSNLHVDTCAVTSVEFEELDSPLTPNPGPGGGLRIFPDKQTPTDSTDRSLVQVVAHTNQPNCPVTLRAMDIDDPSANGGMVDPNGPAGDDNRGGCGAFADNGACAISLTSGPDGKASEDFFVTHRPGDNFVFVAGSDATEVGAVTSTNQKILDKRGNKLPTTNLKTTDMLTVWRRLHIELDSMGIVAANHAAGRVATVNASGPDNIRLGLTTSPLLPLNRFEHGRLVVGSVSLPVISSDGVSVVVANPGAAVVNQLSGQPFTLYDDDDFALNDGATQRGDEGEDVPTPDMRFLRDADDPITNVLYDAYVLPTYDIGQDGAVPFVLNTASHDGVGIRSLFRFNQQITEANPEFWTVYVLGAYQHTVGRCSDPDDPENANMGKVDSINGQGAVIFVETIRDIGETSTDNQATTVAHEIGHLFGLLHGEGGLMGDDDEGATITLIAFVDVSLAKIRSIPHP